jgi:hypothetical protein
MNYQKKFRGSKVSNISIKYGSELHRFNLIDIVQINEHTIERELKRQPGYYGFCLLLQKKLTTLHEELKQERKRLYGKLYLRAKSHLKSDNGRGYSDEAAKAYVLCNKEYVRITKACIESKDHADTMWAVIRAFEQRKDLMQTISSNKRKEY